MPAVQGLSDNVQEYLEAIHRLSQGARGVSTTGLAQQLGVKPASVTGMLRRLRGLGLISYRRYHDISLTRQGERQAHGVIRRHRLAERLLTDVLKLPLDEAHGEACRLEHALSPEVERQLAAALGSPASCPHGHPVDAAVADRTIHLLDAPSDRELTIARLEDESSEVVRYLADRKLLPGARITITQRDPLGGAVQLQVGRATYTLGERLASTLRVERPARRR
jgi:DtxR family Mn-dependent transcriptional regulator